jgi:ribosomal protein S18 acetylase RimI-like enzyme
MMHGFTLKRVYVADVTILQQISIDTFRETFAATNDASDLQQYLDTSYSLTKLTAEILNPESSFYLLYAADVPVGYLKVNFGAAQTEKYDENTVELERIYLLAAYHGIGAGQFMLDSAIQFAKEARAHFIWLGVWEHNQKAIRFYEKNDFVITGSHVFQLGTDMQTDLLMKRQVRC